MNTVKISKGKTLPLTIVLLLTLMSPMRAEATSAAEDEKTWENRRFMATLFYPQTLNIVSFKVERLSTSAPEIYKECERFVGSDYAFLGFGIMNYSWPDKITWAQLFDEDRVIVCLKNGDKVKSIDISQMPGFYMWKYRDYFTMQTVYPGRSAVAILAFPRSFKWQDVSTMEVYKDDELVRSAGWDFTDEK